MSFHYDHPDLDEAMDTFLDNALILCSDEFVASLERWEKELDINSVGMIDSALQGHCKPKFQLKLLFDVQSQQRRFCAA